MLIIYLISYHNCQKLPQKGFFDIFCRINPKFDSGLFPNAPEVGSFSLDLCQHYLDYQKNCAPFLVYSFLYFKKMLKSRFYWNYQRLLQLILLHKRFVFSWIHMKKSAKTIATGYFCPENYLLRAWKSDMVEHITNVKNVLKILPENLIAFRYFLIFIILD